MKLLIPAVLILGLLFPPAATVAFSDEARPDSPGTLRDKDFQKQMKAMTPMFGNMARGMMQGRFAALAAPETTQQLARFARSYYEALVAEGFTKDEALQIVIAVGIPSAQ